LLGCGLLAPGCKVIESTADTLADATAGTAVSDVLRGTARAAESMRPYSPAEEHYIGRAVAAEILSRYKVHPDNSLQHYVNLVGLSVLAAPQAGKTLSGYHFIVIEGKELQAVSAPAGFVFLTEGTVRRAKDEDELASVLAHEVAHVTLKHGIGSIKAATRQQSLVLIASGAGKVAQQSAGDAQTAQALGELTAVFDQVISEITENLLVKGYSRDTEIEADKLAVEILKSSGYSRAGLVNYLSDLQGEGGQGGWAATHPSPNDRIEEIVENAGAQNAAAFAAQGVAPGRDVRRTRFAKAMAGG
jgi:predicted Zn-dependent protease